MKPIQIVIETPKGSIQKFALDMASGFFKLKKILPFGMQFPYDFGIIPNTLGEDNDPLDALVVSEFCSFPGCVIECRLLGALLAEQQEKKKTIRNDRYFFVPVLSKQFEAVKRIEDLPGTEVKELEDFFIQYNKEEGKTFKLLDVINAKKALQLIKEKEMNWQHFLFAREDNLTALQMAARASIIFIITLVLIRIGGVRIFGKKSAFDTIVIIVMGSVLARSVVGASAMGPTIAAAGAMIIIHHVLAWISIKNEKMEALIKGRHMLLYTNGKILYDNLRKKSLSETDLMESLRLETKKKSLEDIETAFMETNGRISFILKKDL